MKKIIKIKTSVQPEQASSPLDDVDGGKGEGKEDVEEHPTPVCTKKMYRHPHVAT